jgi:hypothetical protein
MNLLPCSRLFYRIKWLAQQILGALLGREGAAQGCLAAPAGVEGLLQGRAVGIGAMDGAACQP